MPQREKLTNENAHTNLIYRRCEMAHCDSPSTAADYLELHMQLGKKTRELDACMGRVSELEHELDAWRLQGSRKACFMQMAAERLQELLRNEIKSATKLQSLVNKFVERVHDLEAELASKANELTACKARIAELQSDIQRCQSMEVEENIASRILGEALLKKLNRVLDEKDALKIANVALTAENAMLKAQARDVCAPAPDPVDADALNDKKQHVTAADPLLDAESLIEQLTIHQT